MTEFKDAIENIVKVKDIEDNEDAWKAIAILVSSDISTITKALRIADRLMGEPSQKTKDVIQKRVGINPEFDDYFIHDGDAEWIFEDIRDQLLREIEQEQHH